MYPLVPLFCCNYSCLYMQKERKSNEQRSNTSTYLIQRLSYLQRVNIDRVNLCHGYVNQRSMTRHLI